MCGIAGFVTRGESLDAAPTRIASMLKSLEHRGPDRRAWLIDDRVVMGTQRLAIVDVVGGSQPMQTTNGDFAIAMNGEVFNYRHLAHELEQKGSVLRTGSDTEVALEILANRGLKGVHSFNGMFAIALFDKKRRKLHLIRDRFGVKPLYLSLQPDVVAFASEVGALLASGLVDASMSEEGIWDFLTLRYVPTQSSAWKNIQKLPPGSVLTVDIDTLQTRISRFWRQPQRRMTATPDFTRDEAHFAQLLEDAVKLRMQADVPVGVALSGGLDSSVIAYIAGNENPGLRTYAVGFEGQDATNELEFAHHVAEYLGTQHSEVTISRDDFLSFFPEFAAMCDEPMADLASIPFFFLCKRAAADVRVLLSGEGADETLAGYDFDRVEASLSRTGAGTLDLARRWIANRRFRNAYRTNPIVMTNQFSTAEKQGALSSGRTYSDSLDHARRALEKVPRLDPLDQILYVYRQDWLVEDLLFRADRVSMANSIEVRTPYLDYRLVSWLARIPRDRKIGADGQRTVTKSLLRRYARDRLPATVTSRPKMGFSIPVYGWHDSEFAAWTAEALLSKQGTRLRELLQDEFILSVYRQALDTDASNQQRHRLWTLLTLEYWLRAWA